MPGLSLSERQKREHAMDMWMKIAWAAALGVMLIVLIPRAKHMLKNSRKAEASPRELRREERVKHLPDSRFIHAGPGI